MKGQDKQRPIFSVGSVGGSGDLEKCGSSLSPTRLPHWTRSYMRVNLRPALASPIQGV